MSALKFGAIRATGKPNGGFSMPMMSDLRRRAIQAKQRKAENKKKREEKAAKRAQNAN
jgi:hypothetical protein